MRNHSNQNEPLAIETILKNAIIHVKKLAPINSTHSDLTLDEYFLNIPKIIAIRAKENSLNFTTLLTEYFAIGEVTDKIMRRVHKASKKFSAANCQELSILVAKYLKKFNISCKVLSLKDFDHVFVVVGLNPFCDLSDPSTWGKKAFICDPLNELVFPAKDYLALLKGHRRNSILSRIRLDRLPKPNLYSKIKPNIDIPFEQMKNPTISLQYSTFFSYSHTPRHVFINLAAQKIYHFKLVLENLQLYRSQEYSVKDEQKIIAIHEKISLFENKIMISKDLSNIDIERTFHKLLKQNCLALREVFKEDEILHAFFKINLTHYASNNYGASLEEFFASVKEKLILNAFQKLTNKEIYTLLKHQDATGKPGLQYCVDHFSNEAFAFIFKKMNFINIINLIAYKSRNYPNALIQAVDEGKPNLAIELSKYIAENSKIIAKAVEDQQFLIELFQSIGNSVLPHPATYYYLLKALSLLPYLKDIELSFFPFNLILKNDINFLQLLVYGKEINYEALDDCMSYLPADLFIHALLHENEFSNSALTILYLSDSHQCKKFLNKMADQMESIPQADLIVDYIKNKLTPKPNPILYAVKSLDYLMFSNLIFSASPNQIDELKFFIAHNLEKNKLSEPEKNFYTYVKDVLIKQKNIYFEEFIIKEENIPEKQPIVSPRKKQK